jgi:hypothetical protein
MRRLASGLLLLVTLTGCVHPQRSWSYAPEPRSAADPLANVRVIVLPFEDRRPNENSNFIPMGFVPLMPFGWLTYHTPEGAGPHVNSAAWQFRPADDFALAVAQEIDNARIFRETFVGNRASDADYVLLGELASTKYEGKVLTYGLSSYGQVLWPIGLPATTMSNELILTLKLAKTPSAPAIWTHTIRRETAAVSWIYGLGSDFNYAELLKQGLRDAIPSLAETARTLKRRGRRKTLRLGS